PVSHRTLGNEAVFAVTSTGWMSGAEFRLPFHLAAFQVQAIEEVMQHHLVREFDVAFRHAFDHLFDREPLFLQFGDVLVAVFGADLRWFRLALSGYSGYVDP